MTVSLAAIITEIQSLGVRIHKTTLQRTGGAGPAEAGSLVMGGFSVNVPTISPYVARSPYGLRREENSLFLFRNHTRILPVQTVPLPRFYHETLGDGISCREIALLHGTDCLATSVLQTCTYWNTLSRCRFCGIELSLNNGKTIALKTPEQLAETADRAKVLDGIGHVVLTTGVAAPPEREFSILARSARAIKKRTALPIHAQFMPPRNMDMLPALKDAGVDTVGIHIESFDGKVLKRVAPVKAAMGLKHYRKAWEQAIQYFGPNQVSSFVLVGLGETPDSVIGGSDLLADMGVYPFVVPLRPIPGSRMADALPPDPETMGHIYRKVSRILSRKGLSYTRSLAGCVRCGACSALPAHEGPFEKLICHPSRTHEECEEAFSIRRGVFVLEQKLFKQTDRDANDERAVHLVVKHEDRIIGTVRVYPSETGNGNWIGGRLAVRKGFRATGAGERLVREAVATVKRKGCHHFTAHIQEKNIHFFQQLGWKPIGPVETYLGRPHQLMEADLKASSHPSGEETIEPKSY